MRTEQIPSASLPPHAPLSKFYNLPKARLQFVNSLFDRTAVFYDRVSALLAFGSDRYYRRHTLAQAGLRPGHKILDIATGTGLVLKAALELGLPLGDLIGIDPSRGMLEENRKQRSVALVQGLGERLPFADATFDFVTMGYALRHVEDIHQFFSELQRVMKSNGRILILEITKPNSQIVLKLMRLHMLKLVPWIARLMSGPQEVGRLMTYYMATIEQCVPPSTILAALSAAGLKDVRRQTWGPILSNYLAVKS